MNDRRLLLLSVMEGTWKRDSVKDQMVIPLMDPLTEILRATTGDEMDLELLLG
jgi:hypothetical protein